MRECFKELESILKKKDLSKINRWFKVNLSVLSVKDFLYRGEAGYYLCPCEACHQDVHTIFRKLFSIYPIEKFKDIFRDIFRDKDGDENIILIFLVLFDWARYKQDRIGSIPTISYAGFDTDDLIIKEIFAKQKYYIQDMLDVTPIVSIIHPSILLKIESYNDLYNYSCSESYDNYKNLKFVLESLELTEYIELYQKRYGYNKKINESYYNFKDYIKLKIDLTTDFKTRWNIMMGDKKKYLKYIDKFINISSISDRNNLIKEIFKAEDPFEIIDCIDDKKWKQFKTNLKNKLNNFNSLREKEYNLYKNFETINNRERIKSIFNNSSDKFSFIEELFIVNQFESFEDYKYSIDFFQFVAPFSGDPEIEKLGEKVKNFNKIQKSYYKREKKNFIELIKILEKLDLDESILEFKEYYRCSDSMRLKFIKILEDIIKRFNL